MSRLFDNILEGMDIAEEEKIYFEDSKAKARMLRKEMTDDDINHYTKVYGFETKDLVMTAFIIYQYNNKLFKKSQ